MREKAISPLRQRMIEDMRSVRKSDDPVWITLHSLARICMTGSDRRCGRYLDE
jgi:hypothetical protein